MNEKVVASCWLLTLFH